MTARGDRLDWTVADGRRGRRWREVLIRDGSVVRSLLLETDPDGRCTRLEIASARGLLTLHPEVDDSAMHGNVVGSDGVRHLAFPWEPDRSLLVEDSPASAAILVRRQSSGPVGVLRVDEGLDPRPGVIDAGMLATTIDADGLAVVGGVSWPLEAADDPHRG